MKWLLGVNVFFVSGMFISAGICKLIGADFNFQSKESALGGIVLGCLWVVLNVYWYTYIKRNE